MTFAKSQRAPAATEPSGTDSLANDVHSSTARHVEDAWGCKARRVGRAYMLTAAERVVALAVLMEKSGDCDPYAMVDVPYIDWLHVVPQARECRVPALVVCRWQDSVRFVDTAKLGPPVVLLTSIQPAVRIQAGKFSPVTQGTRW